MQVKFWQRFIQKFYLLRPLAVPNQGWTLIEMAIVSVIVGILASLAIPSMMSGMGKNEVKSALGQVKGSIQEAQRAAMKNGKSCWVSIGSSSISTDNTRTDPTQTANATTNPPNICITSPVTLSTGITLRAESVSGSTITALSLPQNLIFSYRGNPSNTIRLVRKFTTQSQ